MEAIFFLTQLFNWNTSNEISRRQTLAQHRTGEKKQECIIPLTVNFIIFIIIMNKKLFSRTCGNSSQRRRGLDIFDGFVFLACLCSFNGIE